MKFGFRTPSLKKSLAAKFSIKRQIIHRCGLKMPRGYGWVRSPNRFLYNKLYNLLTIKWFKWPWS